MGVSMLSCPCPPREGPPVTKLNIRRAVENIRANTTVYSPVVEIVVNAIQAIDEAKRTDGKVIIRVERDGQLDLENDRLPDIIGFHVEDNGVGFDHAHREAFDTLYTDHRVDEGGKGFGRFTCLKYFDQVSVRSNYRQDGHWERRSFSMGRDADIIVNEKVEDSSSLEPQTAVSLAGLKKGAFEKKLTTVGRNLVERLLPFFIAEDHECPEVILSETDNSDSIVLNDYVTNRLSGEIVEIQVEDGYFCLGPSGSAEKFVVRIFKLYAPRKQTSRVSLVAHRREVSGSALRDYVPEFEDEFYDKDDDGNDLRGRNYIVKAYVFGDYLDRHVSLERGGFEFPAEKTLEHPIGQTEIEENAAAIAQRALGDDLVHRQDKKRERVRAYVDDKAPWHKHLLKEMDLGPLPYRPSDEAMEAWLQKEKFARETTLRRDVAKVLEETDIESMKEDVASLAEKLSDTGKNDLAHYITLRRHILELFARSLQLDETGRYSSEGSVHDIIFPRKGDTETTPFHDHNLWIVDERLNFTSYVSSDKPLSGANAPRPDLLAYDKRVVFRGDNEPSNPITIFEFKKPQRDDFVNSSSSEDPVQQIIRYVNDIKDGRFKTREGREIRVGSNTPFYGFVVCDLTPKVKVWLEREKDFTPMPDCQGWFNWVGNINLYVEVISWDKVLRDAEMRSRVFFEKLGL